MDGFEKRRDDKKKAIMQTALELFDQYGFEKVSMTDIAEKARVSRASIYNFFESKDNLRRIIIKDILDDSVGKVQKLLEEQCSFIDKISEYIKIRTWYYGKHSLKFFFDTVESDPELRQYLDDFTAIHRQLLMKFIDEGKQSGVFSPEISNIAIEMYIDIFQTYFLQNMNKREIHDRLERNPKLAEEINRLLLDGLIRDNSRKR
ncbi:AcrR family transcriptional regulator [Anaerotaenia torta]|uniref:TetR/AcrR family transcriptional regulator n=1 Tax=Anaerotaenia torta TaxID=433293 RepID=UPI003D205DA8